MANKHPSDILSDEFQITYQNCRAIDCLIFLNFPSWDFVVLFWSKLIKIFVVENENIVYVEFYFSIPRVFPQNSDFLILFYFYQLVDISYFNFFSLLLVSLSINLTYLLEQSTNSHIFLLRAALIKLPVKIIKYEVRLISWVDLRGKPHPNLLSSIHFN